MQRHTPPPSHAHASGLGSTPEAASSKWRRWRMFPSERWAGERHALASNRVGTSGGVRLDGNRSRPAPSRAIAAAGGLRAPLGGTATHLVGAATDVGDEHAQPTDVVLHQGRHGDTALALDPLWAFAVQNALLLRGACKWAGALSSHAPRVTLCG